MPHLLVLSVTQLWGYEEWLRTESPVLFAVLPDLDAAHNLLAPEVIAALRQRGWYCQVSPTYHRQAATTERISLWTQKCECAAPYLHRRGESMPAHYPPFLYSEY